MGTKADFYVGIGPKSEWLGSISFDGYPPVEGGWSGAVGKLIAAKTEEE